MYTGCTDVFPSIFIDEPRFPTLDGDLLLICHCLSFHLFGVQAPNPKGASGREWCYVEPQVELSDLVRLLLDVDLR